ncbi:MAG: hypothetical protein LBI59_05865, partial [Candidatus Accumulibacter sp.]|nr:hypothetical protein [Accumulibacter sp.]
SIVPLNEGRGFQPELVFDESSGVLEHSGTCPHRACIHPGSFASQWGALGLVVEKWNVVPEILEH